MLEKESCLISAASYVELGTVLVRRMGASAKDDAADLAEAFRLRVLPLDRGQAEMAIVAMAAFGKGRARPPAVLNYGDLFSYALAEIAGPAAALQG